MHLKKMTFVEFGKNLIHYPKLNEGVINIRYKSGANHVKFPVAKISKHYKDFLLNTNCNIACRQ